MMVLPDDARCLGCGYCLRGLHTQQCPECGREFDPSDPRTYGMRGVSALDRWMLEPMGRACWWAAWIGATLVFWGNGFLYGGFLVAALGWAVVALVVVYRLVRIGRRETLLRDLELPRARFPLQRCNWNVRWALLFAVLFSVPTV